MISLIFITVSLVIARDISRFIKSRSKAKKGIIQTVEREPDKSTRFTFQALRPVFTVILLCIYVYAIHRVNFYVASFLFLMAQCCITDISRRHLPVAVVVMLGLTGFSYVLFEVMLQIPL